jgi:signal transduction histidine kinase
LGNAVKLPIRLRLAAIYCLVLAFIVAGVETGSYLTAQAAIHSLVDRELETRLAGIQDHLARHMNRYSWDRMRTELNVHPAFQPDYLAVRSGSGQLLFEGRAMQGVRAVGPGINDVRVDGGTLRLFSVRRTVLGEPYDLMMATDLRLAAAILQRLWLLFLISIPPLLLVCAWLGYWMSGRALAPIQRIIAAARSIDSTRLGERVSVPDTGDEVHQLAVTFNGMLHRIETGFAQIRAFTANASHELRTPVAIIRAAAEVALLRPHPSEAFFRQTLERILRESERNTKLIDQMMELARLDSGVEKGHFVSTDLGDSVAEAAHEMASLAAARGTHLSIAPSRCDATVAGDRDQLRRLWLILLDNAIKYTPEGGSITVEARLREGRPIVAIRDTGIGIPPEHQALVFQRFYRTDKARSRALGGAGLGLSIAQEIAMAHGARIELRSSPGQGSEFSVCFTDPARRQAQPSLQFDCEVLR